MNAMLLAEELSDLGADFAYTAHFESDSMCRLSAKKQYMAQSSNIGANSVNTRVNGGSRVKQLCLVCLAPLFCFLDSAPPRKARPEVHPAKAHCKGHVTCLRAWVQRHQPCSIHQYAPRLFVIHYSLQQHHHHDSKFTTWFGARGSFVGIPTRVHLDRWPVCLPGNHSLTAEAQC